MQLLIDSEGSKVRDGKAFGAVNFLWAYLELFAGASLRVDNCFGALGVLFVEVGHRVAQLLATAEC